MTNTLDLLHSKKLELLKLAEKYGVKNVRVFGSVVYGEDTTESDIDLLVDMEEERDLFDLIGFKLDAEDLLGRTVDVVMEETIYHMLRDRILSEARPL